ncbi:hypothetical protein [Bacteroides fragilis]|jgi:hypothetical protein|uniref:hypothetical protein n=1 Tax=Bacteroides fragilis TaxID=817 RepID=UPI00202E9BF3|nr:hypothetical protein [Bacteroides fragilis]
MSRGVLDASIVNSFKQGFEWKCINLLIDAYTYVNSSDSINIDCEEEYISAVLFDYIDNCQQAINWKIDITPEYRLYKNDVLKKMKSAKTAPRIDFRLCGWSNNSKLTYFVEAKNLIEIDSYKSNRKSKIPANKLHIRYIETGIDNYLSGQYPSNGCLVGYILQGKTENIVSMLNTCLCNLSRKPEILQLQSLEQINFKPYYISSHNNVSSIKHLMFDFTHN